MALTDEVQNRISSARLIQLSNSDGETATTLNTTRLGYACTDVQAEMQFQGGVAYDNDNLIHVSLAVSGVVAKLQEYGGNGGEFADAHRRRWVEGLQTLRVRLGIPTTSSSNLEPVDERATAPRLDSASWRGYSARPGGSDDTDPLIGAWGGGGL